MNSDITFKLISYKELSTGEFRIDTPTGIAAFFTENVLETVRKCPCVLDESLPAVLLAIKGDEIVGRAVLLVSRLKLGEVMEYVQTSSSIEVSPLCRKQGIGRGIVEYVRDNDAFQMKFGSLFSVQYIDQWRRAGFTVFDVPQYMLINDYYPLLRSIRLSGFVLTLASRFLNFCSHSSRKIASYRTNKLKRRFSLSKETIIPDWAGAMTFSDGKKYGEIHDASWLQWNLDNNYSGEPKDIQSFYAIYDCDGSPVAFFMTKERFEHERGRYRDVLSGTIVEWSTKDDTLISESDIIALATESFSPDVTHITTLATTRNVEKRIKRLLYSAHGNYQMVFYDKSDRYPDAKDKQLWRIRYGAVNSIFI